MIQGINKALAQDNISFEVTFISWKRVKAQKGTTPYLGYLPAWPEEVREGFIASNPIGDSPLILVAKNSTSKKFKTTEEIFATSKVGHVRSYDYPKSIQNLLKRFSNNIVSAGSEKSLLKMVEAGRIDFAISDTRLLNYYLKLEKVKGLKVFKKLLDVPLLIVFKKAEQYEGKLKLINKRLASFNISKFCGEL